MASGTIVASPSFDALPEPVLRVLFLALPVNARARAACVCRGWRAFLADPSLWQVLDLTPAGGVAAERVTENLVRGAVARAAGRLRVFSINHVPQLAAPMLLVAVTVSDGAELREVSTNNSLKLEEIGAVVAAAPHLQVFNAHVSDRCPALLPVLRNDPPYGPLRVKALDVVLQDEVLADVLAVAAAVTSHESLETMELSLARVPRGVNALLEAAAERRVAHLTIYGCTLDAETVPALARVLQRGSLTELIVMSCTGFLHASEESMLVLCAALRCCHTLTHLLLTLDAPDGASRRIVTELLDATASLPALSVLDLYRSQFQDAVAAGRAFGALLAANRPNLCTLNVERCRLGDEGMAALLDGLATNTHLRKLGCDDGNGLSEAFERDRLAPAQAELTARAERDA